MTLAEVLSVIEGRVVSSDVAVSPEAITACAAHLMSDVLALTQAGTLLPTGLSTPKAVRVAETADISAHSAFICQSVEKPDCCSQRRLLRGLRNLALVNPEELPRQDSHFTG